MSTMRMAAALVGLWCLASCGDSAGSDCEPDPPCALSGTTEIPVSPLSRSGEYEVVVTAGAQSVAFECVVLPAEAVATCGEMRREGFEDWVVEMHVDGPATDPRALVLELDRSMDAAGGPASIQIQVTSDVGFSSRTINPDRQFVSAGGQTCQRCQYELPETLAM